MTLRPLSAVRLGLGSLVVVADRGMVSAAKTSRRRRSGPRAPSASWCAATVSTAEDARQHDAIVQQPQEMIAAGGVRDHLETGARRYLKLAGATPEIDLKKAKKTPASMASGRCALRPRYRSPPSTRHWQRKGRVSSHRDARVPARGPVGGGDRLAAKPPQSQLAQDPSRHIGTRSPGALGAHTPPSAPNKATFIREQPTPRPSGADESRGTRRHRPSWRRTAV